MSSQEPVNDDQTAAAGAIDNDWVCEHYPRIHRAAWLMTGQAAEAEDLAQETFVVALDRWDTFQRRSSDSTWLYGILIRLVQRRGRSLARMRRRLVRYAERNLSLWGSSAQTEDPQQELARRQWRESVWADVARLPTAQRVAVTLRFAEGMSYQQIGDAIGCPTGTAKSRVHLGVQRLRTHFCVGSPDGNGCIDPPVKAESNQTNITREITFASPK